MQNQEEKLLYHRLFKTTNALGTPIPNALTSETTSPQNHHSSGAFPSYIQP